jgi:hypothetical protein
MIDCFIYFRDKINIILSKANNLSNSKKKKISLDSYNIVIAEWDYINKIKDILEIFRKPTIKL